MAKRFTSTEKWKDRWFYSLKPKYKLLWLYMLDTCDGAGIWEANLQKAGADIGTRYDASEALQALSEKVTQINGDKWFVLRFVYWQYNCEISQLNPENMSHRGALNSLKRFGITSDEAPPKLLQSPLQGAQDKKKDKEKEKAEIEVPEKLRALPGFLVAWDSWIAFRQEKRKPLTPTAIEEQYRFLVDQPDPIAVIRKSIRSGWQGLFALDEKDIFLRKKGVSGDRVTFSGPDKGPRVDQEPDRWCEDCKKNHKAFEMCPQVIAEGKVMGSSISSASP